MPLFGNIGGRQPRGIEPQTQQDIVDEKYPNIDVKTVTFSGDKLPALKEGFQTEDALGKFILNTLRMRRVYVWQLTTFDPDGKNIKWERYLSPSQSARLNLQGKAAKAAEVMFTSQSCAGLRISNEGGIEITHPLNDGAEQLLSLQLTYKVH